MEMTQAEIALINLIRAVVREEMSVQRASEEIRAAAALKQTEAAIAAMRAVLYDDGR